MRASTAAALAEPPPVPVAPTTRAYTRKRPLPERVCDWCGAHFVPDRPSQRFDNRYCRYNFHNEAKAAPRRIPDWWMAL
jgi:hypothetical protein